MIKQKADVKGGGRKNRHGKCWTQPWILLRNCLSKWECLLSWFLASLQIEFSDNVLLDIHQRKKQKPDRWCWKYFGWCKYLQGRTAGQNMDARGQQWTSSARREEWSTWFAPTLAGSASPSATRWATPPGAPTASSQPHWGSWKRGNMTLLVEILILLCHSPSLLPKL